MRQRPELPKSKYYILRRGVDRRTYLIVEATNEQEAQERAKEIDESEINLLESVSLILNRPTFG